MTEKLDGLQRQANDLRSRLDIGPPSLGVLQARSDNAQGRSAGQTQMIGLFLTIGALAIAVIGLVLRAMWGN